MNDDRSEVTHHLIIVIDIKANDIQEEYIESLTQLPLKKIKKKETNFWLNKNCDAIHLQFCKDALYAYDFEKEIFLDLALNPFGDKRDRPLVPGSLSFLYKLHDGGPCEKLGCRSNSKKSLFWIDRRSIFIIFIAITFCQNDFPTTNQKKA